MIEAPEHVCTARCRPFDGRPAARVDARTWRVIPCASRDEAFRLEGRLRAFYRPPWNVQL